MKTLKITNNSEYVVKAMLCGEVYDISIGQCVKAKIDDAIGTHELLVWKLSPDMKEEFDVGLDTVKPLFTEKVVFKVEKNEIYGTATLAKLDSDSDIVITDKHEEHTGFFTSNVYVKRFACSSADGKEYSSDIVFMTEKARNNIASSVRSFTVVSSAVAAVLLLSVIYELLLWWTASPEYLGISAVIFFSLICLVFAYAAFDSNKRMKKYKKTRLFGEVFNKMKGQI